MATSEIVPPSFELVSEELKDRLKAGARFIDPCGDWPRTLFLQAGLEITQVPLDPALAVSGGDPRFLAEMVIPTLGRQLDAQLAALTLPGWFVDPNDDPDHLNYEGRLVAHPLRRECLNLLVVDSSHAHAWLTEVKRTPRLAPELGEWQGPGATGGAFIEAMQFAVGGQA